MNKRKLALKRLDLNVSTPTNVKGFNIEPPEGLNLYVKYRGDISRGEGHGRDEKPLGNGPTNIEGIILDAMVSGTGMRFMILLQVTKSTNPGDIGKVIPIYPTRDIISLYPFSSRMAGLVHKMMDKKKLDKLRGFAGIHNQLAHLPGDGDRMEGRETIKAKARFEGKKPEWPQVGPSELAEYYHDDYQGRQYDKAMEKSGQIQDETGNQHIGDDKLGGRRRRRKRKTKRKSRKSKKRRRKKRKTRRKRKSRRKIHPK